MKCFDQQLSLPADLIFFRRSKESLIEKDEEKHAVRRVNPNNARVVEPNVSEACIVCL